MPRTASCRLSSKYGLASTRRTRRSPTSTASGPARPATGPTCPVGAEYSSAQLRRYIGTTGYAARPDSFAGPLSYLNAFRSGTRTSLRLRCRLVIRTGQGCGRDFRHGQRPACALAGSARARASSSCAGDTPTISLPRARNSATAPDEHAAYRCADQRRHVPPDSITDGDSRNRISFADPVSEPDPILG